jgi:hypothetical protein
VLIRKERSYCRGVFDGISVSVNPSQLGKYTSQSG